MIDGIQRDFWENSKLDYRRKPEHPVIKVFSQNKIKEIAKYIKINVNTKLLELGAGNGFFSLELDKICVVTATDYSKKMIELNPLKNKQVLDVADIAYAENSFDIVFEANLLHHIDDIDVAIREMKRVSKKYVILIEPNRTNPLMFLFGLVKRVERKSLKFSIKYVKNRLLNNGLKQVACFSHGILLPNKTPKTLLKFLNMFDLKISFFVFYNKFIFEV